MKNEQQSQFQFCVFHIEGKCAHGNECRNPHVNIDKLTDEQHKTYEEWKTKKNKRQFMKDRNESEICRFFRKNACTNDKCRFLHTKDNDSRGSPCYFFYENSYCNRVGCRNNHKKAFTKDEYDRYIEWKALKPSKDEK